MSVPESPSTTATPYGASASAPTPSAPATVVAPFDRDRWLLAGVIGIIGGYLTVSALNSGLINVFMQLDRYEPGQVVLLVAQFVFALAVTSFAFLVAPGALGRRVLAIMIFVVVAAVLLAVVVGRLTGTIRIPGPTLMVVTNPYSVVLATGGLAWLIAAGSRPIAYFTVLLALIVMPINYVLALNNIPSGIATTVQLVLSLVVAVVILLVSRPAAPDSLSPAVETVAPITASRPFDRWRWLLTGIIGILGGYLTVSFVTGGIVNALGNPGGFGPEFLQLFVVQGVFALGVTAFAFLMAPGPVGRRVLAIAVFVVVTIAVVALLFGRYWGGLPLPGRYFIMLYNPFWLVLLFGGLGWLLAAGARPVAYLTLLLTLIVMPIGMIFTLNGIDYGPSTLVQFALSLVIAAVILLVSRPAAAVTATPSATSDPATTDPASNVSAAELAPTAFVGTEEGPGTNTAPGVPAP